MPKGGNLGGGQFSAPFSVYLSYQYLPTDCRVAGPFIWKSCNNNFIFCLRLNFPVLAINIALYSGCKVVSRAWIFALNFVIGSTYITWRTSDLRQKYQLNVIIGCQVIKTVFFPRPGTFKRLSCRSHNHLWVSSLYRSLSVGYRMLLFVG